MATRSTLTALLLAAFALASHPAAYAQNAPRHYAQGVNAYFNGSGSRAESHLTQALAHNHRDARAYYFRGLAKLRQGRPHDAESDFRLGAVMETSAAGRPLDFGRTFERVQGSDRLLMERIRSETRKNQASMKHAAAQQRYQQATKTNKTAMRMPFRLPIEAIMSTESPDKLANMVAAQADSPDNPFVDDPVEKIATPVDIPDGARGALTLNELGGFFGRFLGKVVPGATQMAAATQGGGPAMGPGPAAAGDNPFGGPPAGGNPFGGPPAAAGGDPFGGNANPFGGAASSTEPTEDPFADASEEEDPFADEGASGEEPSEPAAAETEETGTADPFSGEPTGDDPFAEEPAPSGDDPFGDN